MKNNIALTKRELDVMKILWQSDNPCTASEIANISNISISTVHTSINKLLQKNMIKVDDIIFSGKVLSRCYKPTVSSQSYEKNKILTSFKGLFSTDFSTSSFVSAFLGQEKDDQKLMKELDGLEQLIKEKKEELKKKNQQEEI